MPFMPVIQAKLRVAAPNDKYEQEANRVADQIMRMPWGPIAPPPTKATQSVQRLCAECASGSSLCPECAEEEETINAKARPGQAARADLDLTARLQAIRGGGQPLPARERSYFEAWFGRDFSATRIHTDQAAADVAAQLSARAFTLKRDIVFGAGEYPHRQGRDSLHLLAHELTHVVQQGGAVDGSGGNSNANPARAQFATNEPETVRKAPVSPAHPSTNAIFQRWLGGGAVAVTYHPETPQNAEVFPIMDLNNVFLNTGELLRYPEAQAGTWIRYDLNAPALVPLTEGLTSVINPDHLTFWLCFGASGAGYEAQADASTRQIIRQITIAFKRGTPTEEGLLEQIGRELSESTAGCRARYFYRVMTENGLNPSIVADYGNWCGKGGSGPVQDTFDQCCKEHDECYGRNCSIFDVACSPECDRCDDRAVQCWLRAVAADPARYGTPDTIRYPCADCAVTGMTPEKQTRCRTAGCIP